MSPALILLPAVIAIAVLSGCGDDEDAATDQGAATAANPAACIEEEGLELVEDGAGDLPISGAQGGPPLVSGVEGVGVRAAQGTAVVFVYESSADAEAAVSTLGSVAGVRSQGEVMIVADPDFPPEAHDVVIGCFGSEEAIQEGEETEEPALTRSGVENCLIDEGQEVFPPPPKPVAGVKALTVRTTPTSFAVPVWVYESDAEADLAESEIDTFERVGNVLIGGNELAGAPASVQEAIEVCVPGTSP